jgi:hypothetical protein
VPNPLVRRVVVFYVDDMIFSGQQASQEIIDYVNHGRRDHQPMFDFYPITPFSTSRGKIAIEQAARDSSVVAATFLQETQLVKNFGEVLVEKGIVASHASLGLFVQEIEEGYQTLVGPAKARNHLYGLFATNGGMHRPPLIMEHKIADFKSINSKIMERAMYIEDNGNLFFIALVEGTHTDVPFYKSIPWTHKGKSVKFLQDIISK